MKRVLTVCAIAALVATALPLSSATAQTWEIHQYFGAASLTPPGTAVGVPNTNPSITVNGITGGTVYLPVFVRMQLGDSVANPSYLTGFLYGVSGVTSGSSAAANFSANSATDNQALATGNAYQNPTRTLAGGPAVTGANAPAGNFSLVSQLGYASSPPGSTTLINSGHTLAGADANGAYWVGTVAINVAAGSPAGGLDLWFRDGPNEFAGTVAGVPYATTDQTPTSANIGFGADSSGNPDAIRFGTASTLVNGRATLAEQFSSFGDAHITVVVPEPGTIGLLALGLVGLLRRRSA